MLESIVSGMLYGFTQPPCDLAPLYGDHQEALAFYGPIAYQRIAYYERAQREFARLRRLRAAELIDDVASQVSDV